MIRTIPGKTPHEHFMEAHGKVDAAVTQIQQGAEPKPMVTATPPRRSRVSGHASHKGVGWLDHSLPPGDR